MKINGSYLKPQSCGAFSWRSSTGFRNCCACKADPFMQQSTLIILNTLNMNVTALHLILPIKIETTIRDH